MLPICDDEVTGARVVEQGLHGPSKSIRCNPRAALRVPHLDGSGLIYYRKLVFERMEFEIELVVRGDGQGNPLVRGFRIYDMQRPVLGNGQLGTI